MITYIFIGIGGLIGVILLVLIWPSSGKQEKGKQYEFVLRAKEGVIKFKNPFDNFLIYAGANGGKTKSIGKPLLGEYIKAGFAGFIYDFKDFDLTKTAYHFKQKYNYPFDYYYLSFVDMERTFRTNIIKPSIIQEETVLLQVMEDLLKAYQSKDSKQDEWFGGALGILRGVALRFFREYPDICTIPHIVIFICSAGTEKLTNFLEGSFSSRMAASGFLDAKGSPKTQSSILSSLTIPLSVLANEKKIAYVLTGDDFDFNLVNPERPKLVAVANSFRIQSLISPIIALMVTVSTRHFSLINKIPCVYFADEMTTFRIPDFEGLPSVLREYKCSFVLLTQSAAKLEKVYGKYDRSSIESNFGNQFYGKTKDVEALKTYPLVFGKREKTRISRTLGNNSKGGENRSRTTSTQREEVYDTNFFTNLKAGEFVGSAAHSNYRDFHLHFLEYEEQEEALPIVRAVLPSDIEENYIQIRKDLERL